MQLTKHECQNAALVLEQTKKALVNKDPHKLQDLSDRTLHSSCFFQNAGSIASGVIIYTLAKLIQRQDYNKIPNWDEFVRNFNNILDKAIQSLEKNNQRAYEKQMKMARAKLETISPDLKSYISSVLKKAAINKGSKIHEHGISLQQSASLLGITQWELSEYIGHKPTHDTPQNQSIPVKQRAKMAVEFFS